MSEGPILEPPLDRFVRVAADVCEEAKVDSSDLADRMLDIQRQLLQFWNDGVTTLSLDSDAAERRALELYDARSAVKHLRKPDDVRLLFSDRYRPMRYFFIMFGIVCFSFLVMRHPHVPFFLAAPRVQATEQQYVYVDHSVADIVEIVSPSNYRFVMNGVAGFTLGILALWSLIFIREAGSDYRGKLVSFIKPLAWVYANVAALMLILTPAFLTYAGFKAEQEYDWAQWLLYFGANVSNSMIACVGGLCVLAEVGGSSGLGRKVLACYGAVRKLCRGYIGWKVATAIAFGPLLIAGIGALSSFPFPGFALRIAHANRVVVSDSSSHATIFISGSEANEVIRGISAFAKERRSGMEPQCYVTFKFYDGAKPVGSITASCTRLSMADGRRYFADSAALDDLVFSRLEEAVRRMHVKPQAGK
jgi:hypothetical protein